MGQSITFSGGDASTPLDHLSKTPGTARVLTDGETIFTVYGDIQILSLISECYAANSALATTLAYTFVNGNNSATIALSAASASLASKPAGTVAALSATSALGEATVVSSNQAGAIMNTASRGVRITTGTIKTTVATGPSTGTWKHYLKYDPLEDGAYVMAN